MESSFFLSPLDGVYIILLCALIGVEVIRKVPPILHTPLMSGSNAISGLVIIGGVIQLLTNDFGFTFTTVISSIGILFGTVNISGGFYVTHRMLKMYKKKG